MLTVCLSVADWISSTVMITAMVMVPSVWLLANFVRRCPSPQLHIQLIWGWVPDCAGVRQATGA